MKRVMALLAIMVGLVGCYQESTVDLEPKPEPGATAQGNPEIPADAWTVDSPCMTEWDCADMPAVGACALPACVEGKCVAKPVALGTFCVEAALELAECQEGRCLAGGDGKLSCQVGPAADGTVCGEFHPACGTSGKCVSGLCQDPCEDGDPCSKDVCTPQGCTYTDLTGNPCDDGEPCTKNDTCNEGVCLGEKFCDCKNDADCDALDDGNPCNGYLECTNGACKVVYESEIKCEATGFEPCQVNQCQPNNGKCLLSTAADGTACDDGQACTEGDFCQEGACTGLADVVCELDCDDTLDEDEDLKVDCEDSDCFGIAPCPKPICGDDACQSFADETCANCKEDCGECPPECGDGKIQVEIGEQCDDGNKDPADGCDEACKVEPAPAVAGDLIITEIMKHPAGGPDSAGEWFEVYNTTAKDIDINAWHIKDADNDDLVVFAQGGVIVPAGGFAVLGASTDVDTDGEEFVDYVYFGFNLGDGQDEIRIYSGETLIDAVDYLGEAPWPQTPGASMSLSPAHLTVAGNDDGANWCDGQDALANGGFGSPGLANPECPACGDTFCNGDEGCTTCPSDCDCGAGALCVDNQCVALKVTGTACGAGEECASGFCTDGVCCETKCDGKCVSCSAMVAGVCAPYSLGADNEGECGPCRVCNGNGNCADVALGDDPKNDCQKSAEATCGMDGACDGKGTCGVWAAGTECLAQSCSGHLLFLVDECDGKGVCEDGGSADCAPYQCAANAKECLAECSKDPDCTEGFYCLNKKCEAKKANGANCGNGNQCATGNCVDGVCCNTVCTGLCMACNVAGKLGTCSNIPANTDPANECAKACNGNGACEP